MGQNKSYNGHKNWNHWNVSLWIGNDEGLYHMARELIRCTSTKDEAARLFAAQMGRSCGGVTPDGARYTKTSVRAAIRGMR